MAINLRRTISVITEGISEIRSPTDFVVGTLGAEDEPATSFPVERRLDIMSYIRFWKQKVDDCVSLKTKLPLQINGRVQRGQHWPDTKRKDLKKQPKMS